MIDTQKQRANKRPYAEFGRRLAELRQIAGIGQQADVGRLMQTSQQTISRWEAGTSRPRADDIPPLARVLRVPPDELLAAAGYAPKETIVSFDKPFPVDGLSPESFERFSQALLEQLYAGARVHAVGGQGHTQLGSDIDVTLDNGTCYSFQCKRVGQFGPSDVEKAIAAYTGAASQKFILLSRIASPRARAAIRRHGGWNLWDKEDISRRVRGLSREQQVRLVTTFFPERRFALLGETADGRWQTSDEFFAPYMSGHGAFSHDWPLVGRTTELAELSAKLRDASIKVILLTGAGGSGKSRVLKEAIEQYGARHKHCTIRLVSPTQDATRPSLDELGNGDKLLVVDDAHDRSDLPLLFQYAATPQNNTRLILSLRPYGRDYIKGQAANFALAGKLVAEVSLTALSLTQATELARQALERFSGPASEAEAIARYTRDCSLATVIGAQVVATDRRHFELVKNEEVFRATLLGRFEDVIAGRVGSKSETGLVRKILRVLALIQPFYPEDQTILEIVSSVETVEPHDVSRIIRALTEAGVLFRRGGRYRLSPDLLADYLIENECVGPGAKSTGYAEKVFAVAGERYVGNVLLNLGKLDWRLANGQPRNSRLLDGVWSQLVPTRDYGDPYIKAVTGVAYFQPERALSFAERLIARGQHLRELPQLIKYTTFTFEYTNRACECLWELGKADTRDLNPHPSHAIRILTELCAIEPTKPLQFNEAIVTFALSLLNREDSWKHRYSPFDILRGIMQSEGHTTEANGRHFFLKKFGVNLDAVGKLRARVIDAIIGTLSNRNAKAAALAGQLLHEALRGPMDPSPKALPKWTADFADTLNKIAQYISTHDIDPLALIEVASAVWWHAYHGFPETKIIAQRILASLPKSREFRTLLAFVDGHGNAIKLHADYREHRKMWDGYLTELVADLLKAHPDGEMLRAFVSGHVKHINSNHRAGNSSAYILYRRLIAASLPLAKATIEDALADPDSSTRQFVAPAVAKVAQNDRDESVMWMRRFSQSGASDLRAAVGIAFSLFGNEELPLSQDEVNLLKEQLRARDERVAHSAVPAVQSISRDDWRLAIDLLREVDLSISPKLADEVFMNFSAENGDFLPVLTGEDVDAFFNALMGLPQLDGWWIETFLAAISEKYAVRLSKFFMMRVEHAATAGDWAYRPCNNGPYGHVPLQFRSSPDFAAVLRQVSDWMKSRDDVLFRERSAELFDTMFKPFDETLVANLQEWAETATEEDIKAIAKILGEAPSDFVFTHRDFVIRFVDRARQFGDRALEEAISNLFRSAIGGVRSGTPGEPTPDDLATRAEAEKAVAELPRFSAAFALYDRIQQHASWSIDISIRDGEAFEE
jgi:transcriptional regulator with XRE-family HTH domain